MFRKLVLAVHGYVGIFVGLIFLITGLTGSAIVFREELDHTLNSSLMHVMAQPVMTSMDQILAPVQAAYPQLPIQYVHLPHTSTESVTVSLKEANGERRDVLVNPYTAEILGSRVWERSFIGFMHTLHYTLFLNEPGRIAIGVAGVLMLLTSLTGIVLWTGWRKLSTGFKVRWKARLPILSFDLHNVGGILTSVVLSVLGLTGAVIVLAQFALAGSDVKALPPIQNTILIAQLLPKAEAALPGGKISMILFPEDQPDKLMIRKSFPEQKTGIFDLSTVVVDRVKGTVLKAEKVLEPPPVFKPLITIVDLHYARVGGLPIRILYVLTGLMPLMLLITGLLMWRQRRKTGKKQEKALQQAERVIDSV